MIGGMLRPFPYAVKTWLKSDAFTRVIRVTVSILVEYFLSCKNNVSPFQSLSFIWWKLACKPIGVQVLNSLSVTARHENCIIPMYLSA